jgi:hypothetical protein
LMIGHHFFRKAPLKPLGPGALFKGRVFITLSMSSFVIASSIWCRSKA